MICPPTGHKNSRNLAIVLQTLRPISETVRAHSISQGRFLPVRTRSRKQNNGVPCQPGCLLGPEFFSRETLDMSRQSVELMPESREGISEIESKAARIAASEVGSRASFKRRCVLDVTAFRGCVRTCPLRLRARRY